MKIGRPREDEATTILTRTVSLGIAYNYARFEYDDSFDLSSYPALAVVGVNGKLPSNDAETSGYVDTHVLKATLNYHF